VRGDRQRQARQLGHDWEQRASSPARDFFVASHPGWDVPEQWEKQAAVDAAFVLQGLEPGWLAAADVLEIGCGVGRLSAQLAPRVLSYTGFDIAASMVAEARRRHAALPNARFLECDGLGAPLPACDRLYQLALAWSVFIHCPRDVVAALIVDTWALLAPGGELRFQLRADPADFDAGPAPAAEPGAAAADAPADAPAPVTVGSAREQLAESQRIMSPESIALLQAADYMGAVFAEREVVPFVRGLTGGEVVVARVDPLHLYGAVRRRRTRLRA